MRLTLNLFSRRAAIRANRIVCLIVVCATCVLSMPGAVLAQPDVSASPEANATVTPTPAPNVSSSPVASPSPERSIYEVVRETPVPISNRLIGFVGLGVMLALLYLFSNNRRRIEWQIVLWSFILQLVTAFFILQTRIGFLIFQRMGDGIAALLNFSNEGAKFVFGRLSDPAYIEAVSRNQPESVAFAARFGFIFAFTILPTIIFVAALFAILYHLGVMQRVVWLLAIIMKRTMRGISGAEALTVSAEVFMGQTEAPLTVAPYIPRMTMSEILAMMIGGMGTVSGGILAAYVGLGIDPVFLIATSVMAAPACLMVAKMLYPELETPETAGEVKLNTERIDANLIDAASRGASDGMRLAINVAAMLIAFIALVAMVNALLGFIGDIGIGNFQGINSLLGIDAAGQPRRLGLELIFGTLFSPLAFLMGVPWVDAFKVGDLLGTKLVLNEFVAYLKMSPAGGNVQATMEPRSILIATFALCGFANISSVGILIGGIGGLAPERRSDLARLGWRALFGGFIATCITATVAGILSGLPLRLPF